MIDDVPAGFVADPFMIRIDECWYMFFEVFNLVSRLGEIGFASSTNGLNWCYKKIVIREKFHLAYPHIFEWSGDIYMIPDTPGKGVRLYKAERFPERWVFVKTLIDGRYFSDSTIFYREKMWWMCTGWVDSPGEPCSLKLYKAASPLGPWREHAKSPIINKDIVAGRPAGKIIELEGRTIRFAQDGQPHYGSRVRAFEITDLSESRYEERELSQSPVLVGSGESWNGDGMHHLDMHLISKGEWRACVDGWHQVSDSGEHEQER
ncbi:MAG: hypothetical protein KUG75_07390 [Pseudomonadales bacterium]|nr:hypothetical protein [Pseudomonadales bacterium]